MVAGAEWEGSGVGSRGVADVLFLKQRIDSNYCAVYGTAMLLSLLGHSISRRESHRLFRTRHENWAPPDVPKIVAVIEQVVGEGNLRAIARSYSKPASFGLALQLQLCKAPAVLVVATCRLVGRGIQARHAFVVTQASRAEVKVLDSLCPAPQAGMKFNATFPLDGQRRRYVYTDEAPWELDLGRPVHILGVF